MLIVADIAGMLIDCSGYSGGVDCSRYCRDVDRL